MNRYDEAIRKNGKLEECYLRNRFSPFFWHLQINGKESILRPVQTQWFHFHRNGEMELLMDFDGDRTGLMDPERNLDPEAPLEADGRKSVYRYYFTSFRYGLDAIMGTKVLKEGFRTEASREIAKSFMDDMPILSAVYPDDPYLQPAYGIAFREEIADFIRVLDGMIASAEAPDD